MKDVKNEGIITLPNIGIALTKNKTTTGSLVVKIVWKGGIEEEKELLITFPAGVSHEDYERMKTEIRTALQQATRIGEQRAFAEIARRSGEG